MRFRLAVPLISLFLGSYAATDAWAQRIQNMDLSILGGATWNQSHPVAATNVKLDESWSGALTVNYGYQIKRIGACGVMLDLAQTFPGSFRANAPGFSTNTVWWTQTLGLRFMIPISSRLSPYVVSAGGVGSFRSPTAATYHGVFVIGGGLDVRLSRTISVRSEARDLITGQLLNGAAGRQHVVLSFGFAAHF